MSSHDSFVPPRADTRVDWVAVFGEETLPHDPATLLIAADDYAEAGHRLGELHCRDMAGFWAAVAENGYRPRLSKGYTHNRNYQPMNMWGWTPLTPAQRGRSEPNLLPMSWYRHLPVDHYGDIPAKRVLLLYDSEYRAWYALHVAWLARRARLAKHNQTEER